jgi:hypothetical protein
VPLNNPYRKFSLIKQNIYKGLSEKCSLQVQKCSKKVLHLSDGEYISKNSAKRLPCLNDLETVYGEDDFVKLYVYRKYRFYGSAAVAHIFIDGCYYGILKCNEYFYKKVKSGNHNIKISYSIPSYVIFLNQKEFHVENENNTFFIEMIHSKENALKVVSKEMADTEMANMVIATAMQKKIYD